MKLKYSIVKVLAVTLTVWLWLPVSASIAEDSPPAPNNSQFYEKAPHRLLGTAEEALMVHELCKKYHHCTTTTHYGSHRQELIDFLRELIRKRTIAQKEFSPASLEGSQVEITSLKDDLRKLSPNEPTLQTPPRGLGPKPSTWRDAQTSMLLAICKKYNHCDSQTADNLHCYQLESLLSRIKDDKKQDLNSAKTESAESELTKEISGLEADLQNLKNFGTSPRSRLKADPWRGRYGELNDSF